MVERTANFNQIEPQTLACEPLRKGLSDMMNPFQRASITYFPNGDAPSLKMSVLTDGSAHSRTAREFIGSDNGSTSSRLTHHPTPIGQVDVNIRHKSRKSMVTTEVRSTEGAALWRVKGFSKLDDKPGFCVFSPEFEMAGTWYTQ